MGGLSATASLLVISAIAYAANNKPQFWNLTAHSITEFYLAPSGTDQWGKNQTVNDADGSIDHNEKLTIVDTPPGTYDLKLKDKTGRECLVKSVVVWTDSIFSLDENQLAECTE
jgi:hypothetical protein